MSGEFRRSHGQKVYLWAGYKGALDFSCADTVAGGVDDVIHSACDPVVSVRVAATSVTGEVVPWSRR